VINTKAGNRQEDRLGDAHKHDACRAQRKSPAEERGKDIVGTDIAGGVAHQYAIAGVQPRL
jgi:hypothetical protein